MPPGRSSPLSGTGGTLGLYDDPLFTPTNIEDLREVITVATAAWSPTPRCLNATAFRRYAKVDCPPLGVVGRLSVYQKPGSSAIGVALNRHCLLKSRFIGNARVDRPCNLQAKVTVSL